VQLRAAANAGGTSTLLLPAGAFAEPGAVLQLIPGLKPSAKLLNWRRYRATVSAAPIRRAPYKGPHLLSLIRLQNHQLRRQGKSRGLFRPAGGVCEPICGSACSHQNDLRMMTRLTRRCVAVTKFRAARQHFPFTSEDVNHCAVQAWHYALKQA